MKYFLILVLLLGSLSVAGQTNKKGYVLSVENGMVYIDLNAKQVKVGEWLEVIEKGGYMTHPVTKRKIKKENKVLGILEVGETYTEYSIARPLDQSVISKLKEGMIVQLANRETVHAPAASDKLTEKNEISRNEMMVNTFVGNNTRENTHSTPQTTSDNIEKVNIVIAPAQVNDVVNNGHFGGYVADILMEQMLLCNKVRLLDRTVLGAQMDEMDLAGSVLDPTTTIKRGKGIGARYILQTTMQKPDVANLRTGIPLASVMGAVQGLTGTNIGAAYGSNIQVATLKASVSISVRVVDLQTGEVVFMTSGSGKAKGKSQLALEYGALGGGELNGGAEDFKQTVTGKAIQQAFLKIGKNLKDFFNGNTDRKVMGSVSGGMGYGNEMYARGSKLYLGTQRLSKDEVSMIFSEQPNLFFQYRKALKTKKATIWGGLLGGIAMICTASVMASQSYDDDALYAGYGVLGGGIAISVGSCIWAQHSCKQKLKRIANAYNLSNTQAFYQPKSTRWKLELMPTGFRFTF